MKRIIFIIVAVLLAVNCFAQAPSWINTDKAGGNAADYITSSATDCFGNVYITGYFRSDSVVFGNHTLYNAGGGGYDIFIVKYNAVGTILWAKQIGGGLGNENACNITTDQIGNFYILGNHNCSVADTLTIGGFTITARSTLFVAKFDENGNALWVTDGDRTNISSFDRCGLSVDLNNNVYITGGYYNDSLIFGTDTIANSNSSLDIFVAKINSSGTVLWLKSAGGNNTDEGFDITSDANGDVYVAGLALSGGSVLFGSLSAGAPGGFLAKYDSLGNEVWVRSVIYTGLTSLTIDNFGNIYAAGYFNHNAVSYGSFNLINPDPSGNSNDIVLVKYTSTGNVIWAKQAGNVGYEQVIDMSQDADGDLYLTGFFHSPSFNYGTTTLTNTVNGTADIFVSKCDTAGNVLWAKSAGGLGADKPVSINVDNNGNVRIVGTFLSRNLYIGTDTLTNTDTTGTTEDIFIASLAPTILYDVWPGDANHDMEANNYDLLPIGIFYGQTGTPRGSISNVWQADSSANWNSIQNNGADIKHADCNGDGTIDANDTLAINQNFNLIHAVPTHCNNNEKTINPDIYFVTSVGVYNPGDMVDVEVWAGSSAMPVSGLYGLAFDIHYTASLVQPGTESLTYPASWLGTPGTDALKIAKVDALATTAHGAETRINHTNANGYGKIADFKFLVNSSVSSSSELHLSISNYMANDSAGLPLVFNTVDDSLTIHVSGAGINEVNDNSGVVISPNPFTEQTVITFSDASTGSATRHTLKITYVLGKEIKTITFTGKQCVIEKGEMKAGVYFVEISSTGSLTGSMTEVVRRKIVVQ